MDMFSIDCFMALARRLVFYEAAELMHISQSSFSRQIQILEHNYGKELFIRNRLGCRLTETGKAFLPYAESIANEFARAKSLIEDYKKSVGKRLIIFTDCLPNPLLSEMILKYQDSHPETHVEIHECNSTQAISSLHENSDVVGIIRSVLSLQVDDFDHYPIYQEYLVAMTNKRHPLAQMDSIKLPMLSEETFQLMSPTKSQFYDYLIDLCERSGFTPKLSPHNLWYSTIPELINQLNFVSIMPLCVAERIRNPDVRVLKIDDIENYSVLIVKSRDIASNTASSMFEFCCKFMRGIDSCSLHNI